MQDLRTCEKEQQEKDKEDILMSLIIFEIDQYGVEVEFCIELMTWKASLSKIMKSKPATRVHETAKRPVCIYKSHGSIFWTCKLAEVSWPLNKKQYKQYFKRLFLDLCEGGYEKDSKGIKQK